MLPRLSAQDSLRRTSEVAMGSGTMKKADATALKREWLRLIVPRKKARKPTRGELDALPIKVTRVPVSNKES